MVIENSNVCTISSGSRGAGGPGPPTPVKTSQKKDRRHVGPPVLLVIGPPSDKFLDPLLTIQNGIFKSKATWNNLKKKN